MAWGKSSNKIKDFPARCLSTAEGAGSSSRAVQPLDPENSVAPCCESERFRTFWWPCFLQFVVSDHLASKPVQDGKRL